MICTIKFVIQRLRHEFKVGGGGAEHTSAEGATYVGRSGGILPRENFEPEPRNANSSDLST